MAKKSGQSAGRTGLFMRFFWLCCLAGLGFAAFWGYHHTDRLEQFVRSKDHEDTIDTFETALQPEEILAKQSKLLLTPQHSFGPVTLFFAPHLLLNVKYSPDGRSSKACTALWDLTNGELVLDTNTFHHTQGFADCLVSQASADDFRILHTLSRRGGSLSKEMIIKELGGDDDIICERIENLKKRHLIIVSNDIVRIHVESPLIKIEPSTTITRPVVHRTIVYGSLLTGDYTKSDIQALVQAAFGQDLAIRSTRLVYIPIYEVQVNNPDGSIRKTLWNAICGKEMWQTPNS
jgi:hypothetical protein